VNADFIQSADSGCTPLAVNFTNLSAPGSSASWFVDDVLVNNAASQFNYSFVNSTQDVKIFEVKLLVASVLNVGCMDTAVKYIKVFPKPVAGVLGAVPDNGCSPILISLFSNALGATSYQYDFNDGSVLDTNVATVSHSFVNNASLITRTFNVKLLVSNAFGCSDNTSKLVSVKPTVKAVINSSDTLGCTPHSVGLSGLNSVNSNIYTWDFGDGTNSSLATPVKVYNNLSDTIQNYTVSLVTDRTGINCPDTTTFKLRVYPKPVADFAPNPTLGCNPLPVTITNLTTGYTSATYTFSGNGQTSNVPATAANFDTIFVNDQSNLNLDVEISLTAINQLGCTDTKTRSVTIYPDIKAAFNQSAFTGCAPLKVRLANQSNAGNTVKWFVNGELVSTTPGTLNYTFDNTGFTNRIYKVQLVASSALAPQCTDTASSIVLVYPKPDAGILTAIPEVACSPANIDFIGGAVGANQFNWNFGDGAEFDSSSQSVGHVFFNNNSLNNRIFRVRLVAKNSDGCTDTTFKNVTIRPLVGATIISNDSIGCTPFSASFSGSQSSNANQYEWDFGGLGTSTLVNPNFVFVNNSDSMECHNVRLITGKAGIECSDTAYFRVCVNPRPIPDFSINPSSGCQPLAVSFINQSQLADSSVWVLNSNGFQTETSALNFDTIIENVSSQIKNVRVTLLTYTSKGCVNSIEKQFNVSPFVQAGFVQNLDSNCSPLRVRFTNQSAAGNLVEWFVDGQLVSTVLNNFSYSFVNNGFTNKTFEVKLISRSALDPNCTDTAFSTVTVFPKPNAGVINAMPEIACSPAKIDFVGTSVGATQFNWNFGDATELDTTAQEVSHVFSNTNSINNRNFRVRLIISNVQGCSDSAYKNVTIRPLVRAAILSNDSLGCTPFQAAFVGSQSTNANQYFWDFGGLGSSTLMNPVFTFVNNTDTTECHTVRLITQKSGVECADTAYFKVCIYPRPTPEFNINPVSGCQPLAVNLTNQSLLADSSVWVFNSNGFQTSISSQNFDTIVGNNTAQIKTVKVTLFTYTTKGCVNSIEKQFTVSPFVKADFSQSQDSGCSPLPVSFINLSSAGSSAAWYVDGTQVSSSNGSFNFTFVNNSTQIREVEVKLIVRNNLASSCTDTITKKIYVFPKPEIGVISASPESGCSPLLSQLSATPNMGNRFIWDFRDGTTLDSNLLTVSHEFVSFNPSANLPFNVRLIAITDKGCTDTASKTLLVSPFTIARIGIADSVGCSPLTMQLAGALSQNANRFTWDFGDGSNSSLVANPVKTFTNNTQLEAVYNVRLIASRSGFSCPDTAYKTIRVFANPKASFSANVYSGCGPLPVQFVNNAELADSTMWVISSLAGVDTLFTNAANWDTTFSNPFSQQMNVRVEQHVWTNSGCYNSLVRNILVNPDVKPLFAVSGNGCSPHNVQFTNLSTNPGGAYQWTFGDGTPASTAFSPSHLFIHNGGKDTTFTVSMLAISNPVFSPACNQTFTFPVKVFAKPVPDFSISPQILILPQTSASFTNLTPNRTNWKYKWTFGDNTKDTANGLVVEHNYASIVTELSNTSVNIKMLAYSPNGCKDSVSKTLEIRPVKPVVSFEPDTSGCAPLLVSFENKSKYGSQYLWTFGDGTTSTEQNPSKRYEQAGEYSVSLRVIGPGGEETLKRNNIIQVFENPDAGFTTVPKAPRALRIPEEKMNCFVRYPQPGWTYEWNFGDGNISREKDPVHAYKEPGSYNITLQITSAEGCVDRDTLTNGAIVEKGNIVIVPNAFTPRKEGSTGGYLDKEDGTNDVFYPLTEGVTEIRLQIFNRWGQFLYESTTLNRGWDGTFEGINCKSDVYVYKVWCRFVDGRTETRVGDLTLLR
jgi:gliding motility-associated-like protein